MCVYNVEKYIRRCIKSLLDQTVKDFEIVILDAMSTDNTRNIIDDFDDKRIKYFTNNEKIGIAKGRNKCIKLSNGEYVFFTDGDCVVSKDWIDQGLKSLKKKGCVGVEGRVYFVSEDYKPAFSDKVIKNEKPGQFMTCNIAYKKSFIEMVGGFDEMYNHLEDRDLALKVARAGGRICFNPKMIVYHQKVTLSRKEFIKRAKGIVNRVYLFKKFGDRQERLWRIVYPKNLAVILFPPLVLLNFHFRRYEKLDDLKWLLYIYVKNVYERIYLWKESIKERVFLV